MGPIPFLSLSICLFSAHFSVSLTRSLFSPSCCAFGGRARPKCPTQRYLFLSLLTPLSINPALFLSHMAFIWMWVSERMRQESEKTSTLEHYPVIYTFKVNMKLKLTIVTLIHLPCLIVHKLVHVIVQCSTSEKNVLSL